MLPSHYKIKSPISDCSRYEAPACQTSSTEIIWLDPASERRKGLTEIDELTDFLESKKIARLVLQILRIRYRYEDDIIVAIATTNLSQQNQWLFVPLELDLH